MDFLRWARYHWDRLAAGVLAALALLTLLLGYVGVSATVYPAEQLPYMISGGILGLFLLGAAGILYLSADMRDEWRKLDKIDDSLRALVGGSTREAGSTAGDEDVIPVDDQPQRTARTKARSRAEQTAGSRS